MATDRPASQPRWAATLRLRRAEPTLTHGQIADRLDIARETVRLHLKLARQAGENVPKQLRTIMLSPPQYAALRAVADGDPRPGRPQTMAALTRRTLVEQDAAGVLRLTPRGEVTLRWMDATVGRGEWGVWNDPEPSSRRIVVRVAGEDTYLGWKDPGHRVVR